MTKRKGARRGNISTDNQARRRKKEYKRIAIARVEINRTGNEMIYKNPNQQNSSTCAGLMKCGRKSEIMEDKKKEKKKKKKKGKI